MCNDSRAEKPGFIITAALFYIAGDSSCIKYLLRMSIKIKYTLYLIFTYKVIIVIYKGLYAMFS